MVRQMGLFGLPQFDPEEMKKKSQEIAQKAKVQNKGKTTIVAQGANAIARKVEAILAQYGDYLKNDGSYETIRTAERFMEYIDKCIENGHASIDAETDSKVEMDAKLVGIVLDTDGEKSCYVPLYHTDYSGNRLPEQLDYDIIKEGLEKLLAHKVKLDYHNSKFDLRVVKRNLKMKRYLSVYWDTLIGARLLNENEPTNELKPLWNKYCNKKKEEYVALKFSQLFDDLPFNYIPIEYATTYAAGDGKITTELRKFQERFLTKDTDFAHAKDLHDTACVFHDLEIPLLPIIAEIEDTGICIDDKFAKYLLEKYQPKLKEAELKAQEVLMQVAKNTLSDIEIATLGTPINIGSPQQLAVVFYDGMKLRPANKKKPRGTGKEVFEKWYDWYPEHKAVFNAVQDYRKMAKLISTYVEKMPLLVRDDTGRLHGKFNQYGAVTGRFSSSDPNLQNIPSRGEAKEIRKMFIPPEGYVLIGSDYSQQEPRILAHLCATLFNDFSMVESYAKGRDLYSWMASEVYKVDYDECMEFRPDGTKNPEGKERRGSVKDILLGLMYGREIKSIAEQMGVSVKEAQKVVDMVFDSFPAIKKVVDYFLDLVKKQGYLKTVWGRKRRIPELQLPAFEFKAKRGTLDDAVVNYYYNRLMKARSFNDKKDAMYDCNEKGIVVTDNTMKIADAERQCLNSEIQGSAADMTKAAMIRLYENPELRGYGFQMVLLVHDEIIGIAPKEHAIRCGELMSMEMILAAKDKVSVPMKCDAEILERWNGSDITEDLRGA